LLLEESIVVLDGERQLVAHFEQKFCRTVRSRSEHSERQRTMPTRGIGDGLDEIRPGSGRPIIERRDRVDPVRPVWRSLCKGQEGVGICRLEVDRGWCDSRRWGRSRSGALDWRTRLRRTGLPETGFDGCSQLGVFILDAGDRNGRLRWRCCRRTVARPFGGVRVGQRES
jgi:hypothetical protein